MRLLTNLVDEVPSHLGPRGFPGGAVVENPPANAGDTGSISLVREDPTCCGATQPVRHSY